MRKHFTKAVKRKFKGRAMKVTAVFLSLTILFDAIAPKGAYALTGGPSQPEVQSFEPIGTSDMVDPFSGDFSYNIPLLDVDGYPINISYHSGIGMDQEASWVGLGWNINAGVVNRAMRGIPDDFKGDQITKELNMKPNRTYGVTAGVGTELFGTEILKITPQFSLGIRYNNYTGIGIEKTMSIGLSAGEKGKFKHLSGNLGLTSSSDNGLTISPSVSYDAIVQKNKKSETSLKSSIGSSFNSREGLRTLSIGVNASNSITNKAGNKMRMPSNNLSHASSVFDFGMPTYTPSIDLPMHNFSISAEFQAGGEAFWTSFNGSLSAYYSSQKLAQNTIVAPAYGYMNAEAGQSNANAMMDFNRENEGTFTQNTPALPLSSFTYDIFSVSGQGAGGSYRPFRSDMGYIYDPSNYTTSDALDISADVDFGNLTKVGANVSINDVYSVSSAWVADNDGALRLRFKPKQDNSTYENYYMREANEKSVESDPTYFAKMGGTDAERFDLDQVSKFNTHISNNFVNKYGQKIPIPTANTRTQREKRNTVISFLSKAEYNDYAVEVISGQSTNAQPHHIAQVTSLGTDGQRYVYGIAAYNNTQSEVTFAVGSDVNGNGGYTGDCNTGLVTYNSSDNSTGNDLGLDNYFSKTTTPGYAHSYLLTAVLSPDYVDNDNVRGPSDNDIGSYTRFVYSSSQYKWRTPFESMKSTYNEGLKSDTHDDKANYIYGEKELWYLDSIITKNYVAVFTKENRDDAIGVANENGGAGSGRSKLLRKITLYSKADLKVNGTNAVPVKEVHFEYDYSLCPGIPNSVNSGGKLTLKKIYFTYQKSNKARFSPYEFTYANNYSYNMKAYDRWGNYKPNAATSCSPTSSDIPTAEFPYVEQDKTTADAYAAAWQLSEIDLPSGGKIKVEYESDDYAYVQNKRAMEMFKIVNVDNASDAGVGAVRDLTNGGGYGHQPFLYFKLSGGITDINEYVSGINLVYFRFLMQMKNSNYEYVSGYGEIDVAGISGTYGWIKLKNVTINDNGSNTVSPMVKAAVQFGRLHLPKLVWGDDLQIGDGTNFGTQLINAMVNSNIVKNVIQAIQGPNKALYEDIVPVGHNCITGKSFIRLNNPNKRKLGGGSRVKSIRMSDEWSTMTGSTQHTYDYGQEYKYTLEDGTSSGVASYEPQLGGDENPWKQPIFFDTDKLLAPDDEHYIEEPLGESFFSSPSVGYSRVTVQNLQRPGVNRHATGKVVHEFWTAKDFPTITSRTDLEAKREKDDPYSLASLFHINVKDYMTATQGFVIELNDMHGKPKSQKVYQESATEPITSVEYHYKKTNYVPGSFRLNNTATVINKDGSVDNNATIGVVYDFVADMRQQYGETNSVTLAANLDVSYVPPVLTIPVFMLIPSFSNEKTRMRMATTTKVIQRFGILEEVVAKDLGSVVSTKDLAYDANTGEVLLKETVTDFNDKVYTMTFPAHWYYDGMGQAYTNIDFTYGSLTYSGGNVSILNADKFFMPGDEVELIRTSGLNEKGWVDQVTSNSIHVTYKDGTAVVGAFAHTKVIRSGRRNMASVAIASITSLSNPLNKITSNIYENVLQANASEYTEGWKTFCDCFTHGSTGTNFSTNPYVLGTKGFWKPKKSYLHLTGRTQSKYDNNTNIRKDGVFTSFTPYYKLSNGKWVMDDKNWTFTSEVTEYSPYGPELENKDALGRYSAATFGYNQSLATAVGANTKYSQLGADNFEDYDFSKCADNHFKFPKNQITIDNNNAHTGSRSLKVSSGTPVNLTKQLTECTSNACNVTITESNMDGTYFYSPSGGTGPYTFEYNVISGNIAVSMVDAETIKVLRNDPAAFEIEITVTDSNGCKATQTFSIPAY